MSGIDKKWYVVRAVSGQEKRVQETVETEIAAAGLQDYVGQVLIPMEKVFTIRNGKKVSKERNLFPGYVYIEAALVCLLYTSPSPRDRTRSRMPSSA